MVIEDEQGWRWRGTVVQVRDADTCVVRIESERESVPRAGWRGALDYAGALVLAYAAGIVLVGLGGEMMGVDLPHWVALVVPAAWVAWERVREP